MWFLSISISPTFDFTIFVNLLYAACRVYSSTFFFLLCHDKAKWNNWLPMTNIWDESIDLDTTILIVLFLWSTHYSTSSISICYLFSFYCIFSTFFSFFNFNFINKHDCVWSVTHFFYEFSSMWKLKRKKVEKMHVMLLRWPISKRNRHTRHNLLNWKCDQDFIFLRFKYFVSTKHNKYKRDARILGHVGIILFQNSFFFYHIFFLASNKEIKFNSY